MDLIEPGEILHVSLGRRGTRSPHLLVYVPDATFNRVTQFARRLGQPLFVLGDRISERTARSLREADIHYLDTAGNAYIAFDDVLIDIRGRRPVAVAGSKLDRRERPVNLFSPRRARVVFAVLAWPELVGEGVREVAAAAGVSLGLAHEGLDLLETNGYLSPGRTRELWDGEELLDYWTAAYPAGLAPTLTMTEFSGEINHLRTVDSGLPLYVSGESAVTDVIRPASLTVYVDHLDPKLPVVNRWRSDRQPNIFVRQKFWTDPHEEDRDSSTPHVAPWPLVYADLMASGESRRREAALRVKEEHARFREM